MLRHLKKFVVLASLFAFAVIISCTPLPESDGTGPIGGGCVHTPTVVGTGHRVSGVANSGSKVLVEDIDDFTGRVVFKVIDKTTLATTDIPLALTGDLDDIGAATFSNDGSVSTVVRWFMNPDESYDAVLTAVATDGSWLSNITLPQDEAQVIVDGNHDRAAVFPWGMAHASIVDLRTGEFSPLNVTRPEGFNFAAFSDDLSKVVWSTYRFGNSSTTFVVTDTANGVELARLSNVRVTDSNPRATFIDDTNLLITAIRLPGEPLDSQPRDDALIWNFESNNTIRIDPGRPQAYMLWSSADGSRQMFQVWSDFSMWFREDGSDTQIAPALTTAWSDNGKYVAYPAGGLVYVRCTHN